MGGGHCGHNGCGGPGWKGVLRRDFCDKVCVNKKGLLRRDGKPAVLSKQFRWGVLRAYTTRRAIKAPLTRGRARNSRPYPAKEKLPSHTFLPTAGRPHKKLPAFRIAHSLSNSKMVRPPAPRGPPPPRARQALPMLAHLPLFFGSRPPSRALAPPRGVRPALQQSFCSLAPPPPPARAERQGCVAFTMPHPCWHHVLSLRAPFCAPQPRPAPAAGPFHWLF